MRSVRGIKSSMIAVTLIVLAGVLALMIWVMRYTPQGAVRTLSAGWTLTLPDGRTKEEIVIDDLLQYLDDKELAGQYVTLSRVMEEDPAIYSPTLLLDVYYLAIEVYTDEELTASYEMDDYGAGRYIDAQYYFVTLPEDVGSKTVSVRLYLDHSGADTYFADPLFGNFRDLYRMHLTRNAYPLFIGVFMMVFGAYFLVVSLFFSVLIPEIKGQVISAVLSLDAGLWTLTQFRLTSIFMISNHTTSFEYATYYLFVPLLYLLLSQVHEIRRRKTYNTIAVSTAAALALTMTLHLTGVAHASVTRLVFYVSCLMIMSIWFYHDAHDLKNRKLDIMNVLQMSGPTIFIFFAFLAMLLYVTTDFFRNIPPGFVSRLLFSTGALLFVVTRYMIYIFLLVETEGRKLEFESLTRIANSDTLTGLFNRHYSTDRFTQLNASRSDFCLVSMDLNHLKYVNDTFGHGKGDALLISFAQALKKAFPEHAACCRMGGDEFVVIMESTNEEQIKACIRRTDAEFSMLDKSDPMIPHSVASGYAFRHELPEGDAHAVFLLADQRMYAHKQEQKEKEGLLYAEEGDLLLSVAPTAFAMQRLVSDDSADMDAARRRRLDALFTAISTAAEDVSAFLCDMKYDYSRWGKSVVEYFDLPGEYMHRVNEIWEEHIHPEDREAFHQSIEAIWSGGIETHDMQYRALSKEGKYVVVSSRGVVVKDAEGHPEYFAGSIKNHGVQSHIDPVTGLRNQFGFTDDVTDLLRSHTPARILILGIAQFAQINDVYGYNYGSRVLSKVGRVVMDCAGASAEVYRMDGARFAVLSRDYTEEEIAKSYRMIQGQVKGDFFVGGKRQNLVLNGGLLTVDNFRVSVTTVASCLNYAINESANKKNGELVVFKNEIMDESRRTLEMLNVIRGCIADNFRGFYLCYQYLVDAKTEEVSGAEALLRWKDDFYGNVPPGQFVPVLEQDPLFPDLGAWILRQAMTDGLRFLQKYPDFIMNVNLSYSQLEKFDFVSMVSDTIEDTGFPADHLCLEVTESCRVLDTEMLKGIIDSLKMIGVRFALDDFGTGFSSLSVLQQIHFDVVKIDRLFIRDIETSEQPEITIRAIALLAQNFGSAVCVEGVETIEARDRLRAHPVKTFQGYLYAKPRPVSELLDVE